VACVDPLGTAPANRPAAEPAHRLCAAPMMERTDRHCRYLFRLLSARAWLYTEMVTAAAVLEGDAPRLLAFHPVEHPVALQLGGSDPKPLAEAARRGEAAGYDEINLNVGCPSTRVQAGCFGVALMRSPARVARCVEAMRSAVRVPVTVKTRLGVDHEDSYAFLHRFAAAIADAGCRTLIVHARKAWLKGLSPKQNRDVPPLDYPRVFRLKADFPALEVVLNGGLSSVGEAVKSLRHVDGVMVGRGAYRDPWVLARLDAALFDAEPPPSRATALSAFIPYLAHEVEAGTPLKAMTRHLMGLYAGQRGARRWRRFLGELPEGAEGLRALEKECRERVGGEPHCGRVSETFGS
jgi:tRNA-dihydrouridine synthase A